MESNINTAFLFTPLKGVYSEGIKADEWGSALVGIKCGKQMWSTGQEEKSERQLKVGMQVGQGGTYCRPR